MGGMGLGCGESPSEATPAPVAAQEVGSSQVITVGDIDPDDPTQKIARFQPLADYLAEQLRDLGIREGRVVIARDIDEMSEYMKTGAVDVYMDSSFPTLEVQEASGSEIILRRWKSAVPSYWSVYIALRESGFTGVDDFVGKVIAFEEPHSTSGFLLPAGTLIDRGFTLEPVETPDATVAASKIGYLFSQDEENSVELVISGQVAGAGISNGDFDELPAEIKERIVLFDKTIEVPRQLVSVGRDLDGEVVERVRELLAGLDETEEGRRLLAGLKKTSKFDPLPPDSDAALRKLSELIKLVKR